MGFHIHEVGAKAVERHSNTCNYRNVRTDHIDMTTHMDLQPFAAVFGCKDENIVNEHWGRGVERGVWTKCDEWME